MIANHLCFPPAAKCEAFTTDTFPLPDSPGIQLCLAVFKWQDSDEVVALGLKPPEGPNSLLKCLSILQLANS